MPRPAGNAPSLLLLCLIGLACGPEQFPTSGPSSTLRPSFDLAGDPGSIGVCVAGQPTTFTPENLPNPLAAGDYYTTLSVDPTTTQAGDGRHFTRITDAILAVRSGRIVRNEKTAPQAACRITISVAPGTYTGTFTEDPSKELFPLVLDVPRVTLEGGLRMRLDGRGRAMGLAENPAAVSYLRPANPPTFTLPQTILIVTDSSAGLRGDGINDTRGDSVTIRGFAFQSGRTSGGGGFAIFSLRAYGLRIEENRFENLLGGAADLRVGTAVLERNSAATSAPGGCAFCLAGPGNFEARANYIVRSGLVGILTTPVAPLATAPGPVGLWPAANPSQATVSGVIENNLLREHVFIPVGTAIRIMTHGNLGTGAPMFPQTSNLSVEDNELILNRFGMIFDAGFPPSGLDPNLPTADLDIDLSGNIFAGVCQSNVLVAFTRHVRALNMPNNSGALRQSEYVFRLHGNIPWSSVWYHHPVSDSGVVLNNTLTVDNGTIPNGTVQAYNPAACAAAPTASAGGPYTGSEGGSVAFNGSASGGTGLSYTWTFGDGSIGSGVAPSHAYVNDGVYEVTLVVTDGTGVSSVTSFTTATIANAAPVVGPVTGPAGPTPIAVSVAVSAPFTDAGLVDVHTATIDWGDGVTTSGTVASGNVSGTHAYGMAGTYAVTVTVKDDELAAGSAVLSGVVIEGVNSPSVAWIGLKNSDDVGTIFDLKAEILRNGSVVASGQLNGVNGGSSTFSNAVQRTIDAVLNTAPSYGAGDVLGIRLSVRIAIGVPGHTRGTARLWYGDAAANSSMTTLVNGVSTTLYLVAGLGLTDAPGAGPKSFVDVLVNKNVGGNPFKPFGTWSRTY